MNGLVGKVCNPGFDLEKVHLVVGASFPLCFPAVVKQVSSAGAGCPTILPEIVAGALETMLGVAYIVRCQRCGVARKSYNDPTRGISVIECKRPCGNSHLEWTLLRTIPAAEEWPPAAPATTDIPLYLPPPPRATSFPAERDASPSPARTAAGFAGKVQFKSKGNGSVARSRSTSAALEGKGGESVTSPTAVVGGGGRGGRTKSDADVRDGDVQARREKEDCFVQ